jgi:methylated-DNA-protein-cysteine methyltransferase-like protein
MGNFFESVYDVVARVPRGSVVSYGQIARALGSPRAARQVGWACSVCPEHLPWQRVVMADGAITGGEYASMRRALLEAEGVPFLLDGRVDMAACRVTDEELAALLWRREEDEDDEDGQPDKPSDSPAR